MRAATLRLGHVLQSHVFIPGPVLNNAHVHPQACCSGRSVWVFSNRPEAIRRGTAGRGGCIGGCQRAPMPDANVS